MVTPRSATSVKSDKAIRPQCDRASLEGGTIALLKQREWTDIKDLAAYLAFTHFLGQASQQRFTSRAQSEQWEALKGPSGIDRLEAIRVALRGRATMAAFRRRSEREEFALAAAEQAIVQWRERAERLVDLRARGAAAGAVTEAVLETRLAALERAFPRREGASACLCRASLVGAWTDRISTAGCVAGPRRT